MKKIAVTVMAIALLTMLFVAPVMATPKESSPAWHTYPATDTYYEVDYTQLTKMCLDAGLPANPYPAPPIPTVWYDPPWVLHVNDGSEYYVLTMTIGDEAYPSIACNTFDMTLDLLTGNGRLDYQTTHYFGTLGKLNHGFAGVATAVFYGYGTADYYFLGSWDMQGFGRFTGQTLLLGQDSRISDVGSGYCLVLGDKWYK